MRIQETPELIAEVAASTILLAQSWARIELVIIYCQMTHSLKQLHSQIEAMPSDWVKAIVLSWLSNSNGNLSDFERLIAETADISGEYQWGKIDTAQRFESLSEAEMIAESIAALEDYQTHKMGIPHDQVKPWADSLGSDRELPCPK